MLSPYDKKPNNSAAKIYNQLLTRSPAASAINKEPVPEPNPLMTTTCNGSFIESFLVKLFSRPQQVHANNTNIEPMENEKLFMFSMDNIILASVIKIIALQSLLVMRSLKMNNAMSDVATISKLLSKETFSGVAVVRPIIKNIGAAMSKTIIPTV